MRVLILGSGGREHALAWVAKKSDKSTKVFIAPGNGGTGEVGENVNLDPKNFDGLLIPGGFGVAKNLCTFATQGSGGNVEPQIQRVIESFFESFWIL